MVLLGTALTLGSPVEAQERSVSFGIAGGPAIPLGEEFSEEAGTGFHVKASVGVEPAALPFGVRGDVFWQQFPDEHEGNYREIGALLNAIVGPTGPGVRPYALAGLGVVNHSPPDDDHGDHVHAHEGETTFAFAVGAGVSFPLGGVRGVLEARFLAAGSEHQSIPITIGIRF